jgi:hypothetical protein
MTAISKVKTPSSLAQRRLAPSPPEKGAAGRGSGGHVECGDGVDGDEPYGIQPGFAGVVVVDHPRIASPCLCQAGWAAWAGAEP